MRWMCGASLKDRRLGSEFMGILRVFDTCGEAGEIGNLVHKSVEDCRNMEVLVG